MSFYEKEMKSFFGESDLLQEAKFCDKMMIAKMDDDLRVKLSFTTIGTAHQYEGIEAKIINRTEGEVDKQVFRFTDIIGQKRISGYFTNPYISDYTGPSWSVPVSAKEREQISQAVLDYVGMFQEQGMVQAM